MSNAAEPAKRRRLGVRVGTVGVVANAVSALAAVAALSFSTWQIFEQTKARNFEEAAAIIAQYDSDQMGDSRAALIAYVEWAAREPPTDADPEAVTARTATYFRRYVYQMSSEPVAISASSLASSDDKERIEYFVGIDGARRRFKTFFERLETLISNGYFGKAPEAMLRQRFCRQEGFLRRYWLPVERGQNAALYGAVSNDRDQQALSRLDWLHSWTRGGDCDPEVTQQGAGLAPSTAP